MDNRAWSYCEAVLPKVSRTFALNIRVLRGESYRAVLLAYLWCRIIDTVEDAPEFSAAKKCEALDAFAEWVESGARDRDTLRNWIASLRALDGTPEELDLVWRSEDVAHCFDALKPETRACILPSVAEMARGMAEYQGRQGFGRTEWLRDDADLDRYCYFVAGTVGVLLTKLFVANARIRDDRAADLHARAVSFGLGLQLTNMTKDVSVDLLRGWCYVPQTYLQACGVDASSLAVSAHARIPTALVGKMISKAHIHLCDALQYTLTLPRHWRRVRLFCLWPLWMAMETLVMMSDPDFQHQLGVSPKISRTVVGRVVAKTSMWFWSNRWLKRDFERMSRAIIGGQRLAETDKCV